MGVVEKVIFNLRARQTKSMKISTLRTLQLMDFSFLDTPKLLNK
jgi:hypothetical protein